MHDGATGNWTLRVDDKDLGSVACLASARFGALGTRDFQLGSASFTGAFDLWRVSRGVRNADSDEGDAFKVLYKGERGMVLFIR